MRGPVSSPKRWNVRASGLLGAAALAVAAMAVLAAGPVLADEGLPIGGGHHGGGGAVALDGGLVLWGALSLAGVLAAMVLSRQVLARRLAGVQARSNGQVAQVGYLEALRNFSPNARLFLAYSLLAELGSGIWSVMFNLYLLRTGFPIAFIGTFWLVNMMAHGVAALPAGLIGDRYGRRRAFFAATAISITAQGFLLFSTEPWLILVLAAVSGFGDAFHGVTGSPFMMENSEPRERPHLFSLNACFLQVSRFLGSLSGGFLPLVWAMLVAIPEVEPAAARWALATALPLTMLSLAPLVFIRERPVELVDSFKDLVTLRNVVHLDVVMRFTLLSLMTGAAFGLTIRFFNVFFHEGQRASDTEVGTILALGAIAGSASILISPLLAQGLGKAKSIMVTQLLSVPALVLMAVAPSLGLVTTLFLVRGALSSVGMPLRNQLQMEFISPKERGTAAGFAHTAFDIGGGLGAGLAGLLVVDGVFAQAFTVAAVLILVPSVLYYVFFDRMERAGKERDRVLAEVTAAA